MAVAFFTLVKVSAWNNTWAEWNCDSLHLENDGEYVLKQDCTLYITVKLPVDTVKHLTVHGAGRLMKVTARLGRHFEVNRGTLRLKWLHLSGSFGNGGVLVSQTASGHLNDVNVFITSCKFENNYYGGLKINKPSFSHKLNVEIRQSAFDSFTYPFPTEVENGYLIHADYSTLKVYSLLVENTEFGNADDPNALQGVQGVDTYVKSCDSLETCQQLPFSEGTCSPSFVGIECGCSPELGNKKNNNGVESSCTYPKINYVTPNQTATLGNVPTYFYGQHFGDESSSVVVRVGGKEWPGVVRHNSSCVSTTSLPGTGDRELAEIVVDGVRSYNSEVYFSYAGPTIDNITSPPTGGGRLVLYGNNFASSKGWETLANVSVSVVYSSANEETCSPGHCSNVRGSEGRIECDLNYPAKLNDCRSVKLNVAGSKSDFVDFCYSSEKGELKGVPSEDQSVEEGGNFSYSVYLSGGVVHQHTVKVEITAKSKDKGYDCFVLTPQVVFPINATAVEEVVIRTVENSIDEGTNAVSYRCDITHVVKSQDPQYGNVPSQTFTVNVMNDDEAKLKLWTFNKDKGVFDYVVPFIGPLCNPEGGSLVYGLQLSTSPKSPVTIEPNVTLSESHNYLTFPEMIASPGRVVFGPSNFSKIRRIELNSIKDNVCHGNSRFRVLHNCVGVKQGADPVFFKKVCDPSENPWGIIDVTDDDRADVVLDPSNQVLFVSSGENASMSIVRFSSQPQRPVRIHLSFVPVGALALVGNPPNPVIVDETNWNNVSQQVTVYVQPGSSADEVQLQLRLESDDHVYRLQKQVNVYIERPINVDIQPKLKRYGGSWKKARLEWCAGDVTGKFEFEIEWSVQKDAFKNGKGGSELFTKTNLFTRECGVTINASLALTAVPLYARVRALHRSKKSAWSFVTPSWETSDKCDYVGEYLNTSGEFNNFKCVPCPKGASCLGKHVTWKDVKPLFGWWRNEVWLENKASGFSRCAFPPACLGGKNVDFKGQFLTPQGKDPSLFEHNETCNFAEGYAKECDREPSNRCRLCGTCREGYRHREIGGQLECYLCPPSDANKLLITLGAVVAVAILCIMVVNHMKKGGKRTVSSMKKMIIFNYFQLSYMIASMNVPWPSPLKVLFDIEGSMSTIGEHLLSPNCELTHIPAAELVYYKQVMYILALPLFVVLIKFLWRASARLQGREFRYRGENGLSPSHKDGSVATIVFWAYFLYPTLCRQAFGLLICKKFDDTAYLVADLQEECWTGRHLLFIFLFTIPQIVLYVVGMPLYGLWVAHRSRKIHIIRSTSITRFRYGMLYSAYSPKRWYWGAIISSRKAGIAFITSYLSYSDLELHWVLLFLSLSIVGNMFARPYKGVKNISDSDAMQLQTFDSVSLYLLFLTAWSGLFFELQQPCGLRQGLCLTVMIFIVLMNISFFLFCIYFFRDYLVVTFLKLCWVCRKLAKSKEKKQGGEKMGSLSIEITEQKSMGSKVYTNPLQYRKSIVGQSKKRMKSIDTSRCPDCKRKFSFKLLKHHCRVCGELRCHSCSKWKIEGSRACRKCTLSVKGDAPNETLEPLERLSLTKSMGSSLPDTIPSQDSNATAEEQLWETFIDEASGRHYYYNTQTEETQWEKPLQFNTL